MRRRTTRGASTRHIDLASTHEANLLRLFQELGSRQIGRREFVRRASLIGIGLSSVYALLGTDLSSASGAVPPVARPVGRVVRYGTGADLTNLDPHSFLGGIDIWNMRNIYDGLLDRTPRGGIYAPALATSWELAKDSMTWTFQLRKGVKFHDGADFDAAMVKANVDRALAAPEARQRWEPFVESARVLDRYVVRIKSPKPNSGFLEHFAGGGTVFHSMKAFEKYGSDLKRNPVGTGPFTFVEWKTGELLRIRRNRDYWRDPPAIEGVDYRPITEYAARVLAFEAGDIDVIDNVSIVDVQRLRGNTRYRINIYALARTMFLMVNQSKQVWKNKKVRQALQYAIDRDAIAYRVMAGLARPSYGDLSRTHFGYKVPTPKYGLNPEKAKQMLQEAGVRPGTKLVIMHTEGRYYGDRQVAEALVPMFNAVGFDTELWQLDWPTYLKYNWQTQPNDPNVQRRDLALTDQGAIDPVYSLYNDLFSNGGKNWVSNGGGNAYYNDTPQVDQLILRAFETLDAEQRRRVLWELQDALADESVRIYITDQTQVWASRVDLRGWEVLPSNDRLWRKAFWSQ